MSLAVAVCMQERLAAVLADPTSALAAWAAQYRQTPHPVLGYARPATAAGWPFIGLVPTRDRRDLRKGRATEVSVGVVCGYRLDQVEQGAAAGLLAVDALAEAVLEAFSRPWRVSWANAWWDAGTADRVDAVAQHPAYEIELSIEFVRAGLQ